MFLREIAKRLLDGLAPVIPDLQERADHIFKRQLYGIAITELTSHLSRRSLYCSKDPTGPYSVVQFPRTVEGVQGNVRYKNTRHTWRDGKCVFCGAAEAVYGEKKREGMESHAYEFIHTVRPEEIFNMKFDVIISNPSYQMSDGGGNGASAKPIYHLFVQSAIKMKPRFVIMITPSRWFTGGKGLDEYRNKMLHDNRLRIIHDFPEATDCFSGVQIKGGVSFFLWDRDHTGDCSVYTHKGDSVFGPVVRHLLEKGCETFIRYNEAVNILRKVNSCDGEKMDTLISTRMPFGLPNTYKGNSVRKNSSDLTIFVSGNDREIRGTSAYTPVSSIVKGREMIPLEFPQNAKT